ncbi:murein hydrolase activator EnvC [Curtobacterium sp. MCBD17_021]|uniref:murein hydrolase activator EnvC family protein n=1 Tax=Curtobacterium sp. MCBD17_021 TaxID=2175665 RepID=UPI001C650868|nr:M23 family metallopeptidase [Curtobacterium sp. MCBD17_021]
MVRGAAIAPDDGMWVGAGGRGFVRALATWCGVVVLVALAVVSPVVGVVSGAPSTAAAATSGAPAGAPSATHGSHPTSPAVTAAASRWSWPTSRHVVWRPWDAPATDYGPGHRGVDVVAAPGTAVSAPGAGTVAFAGSVGGRQVVTIDHGGGLVSALDPVRPSVRKGDQVDRGDPVGVVSAGHCPPETPCLHLGARVDGRYVDPLPFLPPPRWPVLLPEGVLPEGVLPGAAHPRPAR